MTVNRRSTDAVDYRNRLILRLDELGRQAVSVPRDHSEGEVLLAVLDLEMAAASQIIQLLHTGTSGYEYRDLPVDQRTGWESARHWQTVLRALYGVTD